jgi:exodeoxyribonuclease V alpha subunit
MVTRNDYATGVFNGDIGLTLPDPARPGAMRVYFSDGDAVRSVLATRLRNVETAFAMTVHKSQGSEFEHTVLVLPREQWHAGARAGLHRHHARTRILYFADAESARCCWTPSPSVPSAPVACARC